MTTRTTSRARAAVTELRRRRERLAEARAETSDPLAWGRRRLPAVLDKPPAEHHRWLTSRLHRNGPTGVRAIGAAPRGAGKSTVLLLLMVLVVAIRRSHRFVVILRATHDDAIRAVEAIRSVLDANPWLAERFPWLRELRFVDGELELVGCVILARGAGSAIRGLQREHGGRIIRPDLVLGDDLETDASARSKLLTDRLERWLLGPVAQLAGPPGDPQTPLLDLVVIGTTLGPDALITRATSGEGTFTSWDVARFPAEYRVEERDGERVAVDTAGEELDALTPDPDVEPGERAALWPDGLPLGYLDRLTDPTDRLFVGANVYATEYLLDPQEAGSTLFDAANTAYVPATTFLPHTTSVHHAGSLRAEGYSTLERLALGVDPAVSKSDAADYTALVLTGLYRPEGADVRALGVPYAERRRVSMAELMDWAETVALEWGAAIVFEAEGAFAWGAQELRRRGKVPVRAVTTGGRDKRARAQPLTVWHEAGRVHLAESLKRGPLPAELHSFTGTGDAHDDLVDALVYAAAYATSAWRIRD